MKYTSTYGKKDIEKSLMGGVETHATVVSP